MKNPKFRHIAAEALESAGQRRLPGIDTLRALVQPIVSLLQAAKVALSRKLAGLAAVITESDRTITVRLSTAILTLSGAERNFLDADVVRAEIAGCTTESDTQDVLEGMGFSCRKISGVKVGAIDLNLLDHNEVSFAQPRSTLHNPIKQHY